MVKLECLVADLTNHACADGSVVADCDVVGKFMLASYHPARFANIGIMANTVGSYKNRKNLHLSSSLSCGNWRTSTLVEPPIITVIGSKPEIHVTFPGLGVEFSTRSIVNL